MARVFNGFGLIELIFCCAFATISFFIMLPCAHSFLYRYHANNNLLQVGAAINYARSLAIAQQVKVVLCPTLDQEHCALEWKRGMLVASPKGSFYIPLLIPDKHFLTLQQSGFNNQLLTIDVNGMTNHHGHFNYNAQKYNARSQYKLYFNRALRIYLAKGDK